MVGRPSIDAIKQLGSRHRCLPRRMAGQADERLAACGDDGVVAGIKLARLR